MSIQNAGYGPFSQIWSQICEAVVVLHKVNVKGPNPEHGPSRYQLDKGSGLQIVALYA